jgi:integrase
MSHQDYGAGSVYPFRCERQGADHRAGKHSKCKVRYWIAAYPAGKYPNGRTRRVKLLAKTRKDASAKLAILREQSSQGFDRATTVGAYLQWWLANVAATNVKPATFRRYRQHCEAYITRELGHRKLCDLTSGHVQVMVRKLSEAGMSDGSVRSVREVLSNALNHAANDGTIARNVATGQSVKTRKPEERREPLSLDEARTVLAQVAGDRYEVLYRLALTLGLRSGELRNLTWSDVDLTNDTVTVQVQSSKTKNSTRTVPLVAGTALALSMYWEAQGKPASGLVFPSATGKVLSISRLLTMWKQHLASAGIAPRRFHDARHTAGDLMVDAGVPMEVVSKILGHGDSGFTNRVYAKVTNDRVRSTLTEYDYSLS